MIVMRFVCLYAATEGGIRSRAIVWCDTGLLLVSSSARWSWSVMTSTPSTARAASITRSRSIALFTLPWSDTMPCDTVERIRSADTCSRFSSAERTPRATSVSLGLVAQKPRTNRLLATSRTSTARCAALLVANEPTIPLSVTIPPLHLHAYFGMAYPWVPCELLENSPMNLFVRLPFHNRLVSCDDYILLLVPSDKNIQAARSRDTDKCH
jgi:hypothetical protein